MLRATISDMMDNNVSLSDFNPKTSLSFLLKSIKKEEKETNDVEIDNIIELVDDKISKEFESTMKQKEEEEDVELLQTSEKPKEIKKSKFII